MRVMLKFTIPVEKGNQAARDGTLVQAIDALIEQTQPEAAYFTLDQGKRAGMIFFAVGDQAQQIPKLVVFRLPVDRPLRSGPVRPVLSYSSRGNATGFRTWRKGSPTPPFQAPFPAFYS